MGFTAFDLEIKESPIGNGRSWGHARSGGCGVSVLCLYDSDLDQFMLFDDHNLNEGLEYLRNSDLVVGFNSIEFDRPCLEGVLGEEFGGVPHFDILQQVWKGLGRRQKGYKLDDICRRTLGLGKSGSGAMATDLYAAGRYAELHTYCLQDVHLTALLFDFLMVNKYIVDPEGHDLEVPVDRFFEAWFPEYVHERQSPPRRRDE